MEASENNSQWPLPNPLSSVSSYHAAGRRGHGSSAPGATLIGLDGLEGPNPGARKHLATVHLSSYMRLLGSAALKLKCHTGAFAEVDLEAKRV